MLLATSISIILYAHYCTFYYYGAEQVQPKSKSQLAVPVEATITLHYMKVFDGINNMFLFLELCKQWG